MIAPIRIGTRGSKLARWQAEYVAALLHPFAFPCDLILVEIATAGDEIRDVPLPQIGGEGVFTKEIQRALLDGLVDVAVHSLKDLPTAPVEGLILAAVPPRGPTGDALISANHAKLEELPRGARIATSSLRRRAQLLHYRPDLSVVNIRGNVETRLRKLTEEGLDALVLAQAGLERLGLGNAISELLDPTWMLPAVGQGALGVECRASDTRTLELCLCINHPGSFLAVAAERALLLALGGGCQVPIGAAGTIRGDRLELTGAVLDPSGRRRVAAGLAGCAEDAEELGRQLARELLASGAGALLAEESAKPE